MRTFPRQSRWLFLLLAAFNLPTFAAVPTDNWSPENLVAWCIVPYDARKRGPEERAVMLDGLHLRKLAYDWRAEHVPTFDDEVATMKRHGIEIVAWWFPTKLDPNARQILDVIARHGIHPQLWVTGSGGPTKDPADQEARVANETARIKPIADAAAKLGCKVGLYNHGGWFGEPENQLLVLEKLRAAGCTNVGLVYNFHHGHEHIARFASLWPTIQRDTLAVNVNGMKGEGGKPDDKILYVGEGDREAEMIAVVRKSGWRGLVGILNHRTDVDAAEGLQRNLDGLERIVATRSAP